MTGAQDAQAARLRALELLSDVAVHVASSRELPETLERVTHAVVDSLGFGAAVLNLVVGDEVEVAVVAGPAEVREALLGTRESRTAWDGLFALSQPRGALRFVDGRQVDDLGVALSWVPDLPVPADEDAWHPLDALFAPLRSSAGELLGVLSVDLPHDGRRPGAAVVELLERFAVQAALAVDRARMLTALTDSADLFRLTFDDAPLGMALLDEHGRVVRANTSCALLAGAPLGVACSDLVHADDAAQVRRAVDAVLAGAQRSVELTVRSADGAAWARAVMSRIASRGGTRVLVQVQDVTEQRRAEAVLRHLATTDPLTGLANRARLQDALETMLAARRTDGRTVAVLYCDLDHFKQVNDSYGHAVGDELLVAVAGVVRGQLRGSDVAGRLGGDEFVVLLDGPDGLAGAAATAERLRRALGGPVALAPGQVVLSVSIGVALAEGSPSATALLAQADAALYRAKAGGRGRAEVFAA